MKMKAFAMGAVVGFLFAVSPSCSGPTSKKACNAATCSTGCCDSNGACQAGNTVAACGSVGNSCSACSSTQECKSGKCETKSSPSTAVDAGVCNNSNCPGCCIGTTCLPGTSTTSCGLGGAACSSCDTSAGQTCTNQVCSAPDAGAPTSLGKACAVDGDCSDIGTGAFCKLTTATDAGVYKNGYCTKVCQQDGKCPAEGLCLGFSPSDDEKQALCILSCDSPNSLQGCREGYACYGLNSGDKGVCWIYPAPQIDAGAPFDKVGNACATDTDCSNPPQQGICLASSLPDGGPTAFVDGYCTAECADNPRICSADESAICITFGSGANSISLCQKQCTGPGTGKGDCRTGYVCQGYGVALADGGTGQSEKGICQPNCANVAGRCGAGTCNALGYCE